MIGQEKEEVVFIPAWERTHLVIVLIDVFVQFMQSHQGIEVT